ncbi:hypothetical protein PTW32_11265 [Dechloromonas agitata]|uniref:hypothetical protein n=1 Tax=Dechloromonas agitata TaxID=73030 RepID=UPI00237DDC9C|nr:hypothetical protein [Dechloromonas agitata]MDE1545996.1 hypothetical protein [Dechloromonas agitata]
MSSFEPTGKRRGLPSAVAVSLAIHALLLFLPHDEPAGTPPAAPPLQARLASRPRPPERSVEPPARSSEAKISKAAPRTRVMTTDKGHRPQAQPAWTAAEKAEMDGFLNELAEQARKTPQPPLAERSLAMARQAGQQLAREDAAAEALLELRPNAPPADPFSVELYMDGLVRRLNRSAGFVNNGRRHQGVQTAAVQFRLNPDGSLKSFTVLNAADQADEVAFIRAVIERSLPFAPFPPDIDRAARSLGVTICIRPGRNNDPGFSRMRGNRCY